MLFLDSLPTWLSWLLIIIEIIIAIGLLWVFFKERDKHGIWGQVGSLLGIIVTVISMYHTLPVTKYIFSFAPVEYHGSGYNEGFYYGFWNDGMPQGWGHLEYNNFSDGETYSLELDGHQYRAIYYEGAFDKGYRVGEGTVFYEGGYRDEGTFYGIWSEGKKVFEGKRWLTNDTYNGYRELEVWATEQINADDKWLTAWINH